MKKLSILIALILCVTVGSVYATWFYANETMTDAVHSFKNLGITDVDTSAQSGRISVTDTLILKIDDNLGEHKPGWDTDVSDQTGGNLLIRFIPNSGASDTEFTCTFTIENNIYDGKPIFTFDNIDTDAADLVGSQQISKTTFTYKVSGEGNLYGEQNVVGYAEKIVTLDDITRRLRVNGEITLPTITEYEAYEAALRKVVLKLTISEVNN